MASSRIGTRRLDMSGGAMQSKRSGAYMETNLDEFPSSLSRRARKAAESAARMAAAEVVPPPRTTSKIPQTSSRRDPPESYAWKQTLSYQSRPGNSTASDVSGKASTSTTSASSLPSSRSQDGARQPRNLLRRKPPSVATDAAEKQYHARNKSIRSDSSSSVPRSQASLDTTRDGQMDRTLTDSPASIQVAQRIEIPTTNAHAVTIYPELDRYRDFQPQATTTNHYFDLPYPITTDLPPPTPLFSTTSSNHSTFSGSPSTRFSESPGPGPYSRDTTPTSMSSVSPGLVAPMRLPVVPRPKQSSPADTRPPVTRRRAGSASNEVREPCTDREGLAAVRESSNSSSSTSTVRPTAIRDHQNRNYPPAAPLPPPRKSSEKFSKSRGAGEAPSTTTASSKPSDMTRSAQDTNMAPLLRATPPIRPSRDGITDLQSQVGMPLPVVHSNLSSTSLSERRRSGQMLTSRTNTPLQIDQTQQASVPRMGREPTPVPRVTASAQDPQTKQQTSRGTTRTPSPSVASTFKTRFPLFGRRNKTAPAAPAAATEKKDRQPRKGPAAGTGHEGYGRLGQVRRRSSNLTSALRVIPGTMSSQESLASNQPSDPFLAERMNPVVIAGGEIIHNRNVSSDLSRTESNQSMALPRPSFASSRNNSEASLSSQEARHTLWPSALPRGATPPSSVGHRRMPSDSSDSDVLTMRSTLAFRRSSQRLDKADQTGARLPKPINVRAGVVTPSINSHDTALMSDDSTFSSRRPIAATKNDSEMKAAKKLTKRPRSPRKWNIFGRSENKPANKKKQTDGGAQVSATVKVVEKQPMAFYTMIDTPPEEEDGFADVEDVLREARDPRRPSPTVPVPSTSERRPALSRNQSQEPESAAVKAKQPAAKQTAKTIPVSTSTTRNPKTLPTQSSRPTQARAASKPPSAARPSRLPQVGRIPKVNLNTRAEPPPPSPMSLSFSRPFNRASLQLPSPITTQPPASEFIAKGPSPTQLSSPAKESRHEMYKAPTTEENPSQKEFIVFPPRKDSEGTSTTESSCSGILSYSDATAVVPEPNAPLAEDEVWDEYNDLLEDDAPRGHPSVSSSLGKPFHLEMWGRRLAKESGQPLETPIVPGHMAADMSAHLDAAESECETEFETEEQVEVEVEPAATASSVYSSGMTAKINEVLEAVGAPKSPLSVGEFVSGYGSRTNSVEMSHPQSHRVSTASSQRARLLRDSHTSSSSQGSDDNSAVAQVNLRVGSMTVSKWLTFGHVLFSPVRDELVPVVGSLKRHSILVIDGLGNDDWSFYAAETYPAAEFFNLSPRAPLSSEQQSSHSSFPLSPPNHHQIQYKSHADKLPFGPQTFTCVVYRFPTAAPESHYRTMINEARRVLKPGGYIELSILDVDMNNMGSHARRAVRRLKERVHIRAPDISLASSSDLLLRLLGRKGFADIKTCRVGVPLASTIAASPVVAAGGRSSNSNSSSGVGVSVGGAESATTSCSSRAGTSASSSRSSATATAPTAATRRKRGKVETRSLAELMSAEGPGADESITKMVAKVGRWWYDRCYESVALESGGKSMWGDQALLAECEEWRTSLKLMVCHARIPDGRSRVASI